MEDNDTVYFFKDRKCLDSAKVIRDYLGLFFEKDTLRVPIILPGSGSSVCYAMPVNEGSRLTVLSYLEAVNRLVADPSDAVFIGRTQGSLIEGYHQDRSREVFFHMDIQKRGSAFDDPSFKLSLSSRGRSDSPRGDELLYLAEKELSQSRLQSIVSPTVALNELKLP
jgi:hypothetical protein